MVLALMVSAIALNQDDVLIQQHGAAVSVYDVDSYIHDLPGFVRKQIATDIKQLESDILGMLNMNIIYDYINDNGLIEQPPFKTVTEHNKSMPVELDDSVFTSLGTERSAFENHYRHYLLKKSLYSTLQNYLIASIHDNDAERLARDRFLINKSQYQIPEKRDLAMIQLSQADYSQQDVVKIITDLVNNDSPEAFKNTAKELSTDRTVKYNDGQLGQFHKAGFRYPFADKVFSAKTGVVPSVFQNDNNWYILRVNEIIPAKPADFEAHKKNLVDKIKMEIMERQFQNIINQYAQHEVQVNKQLVDDIFSRYEVFQ